MRLHAAARRALRAARPSSRRCWRSSGRGSSIDSPAALYAAKWTTESTVVLAHGLLDRVASAMSPSTSGTPGTEARLPNSSESRTTTSRPAVCKAPDRFRADVAGAAGHQYRHQAFSDPRRDEPWQLRVCHGRRASGIPQLRHLRAGSELDELAPGLLVACRRAGASLNGVASFTSARRQSKACGERVHVRLRMRRRTPRSPSEDLFRGEVRAPAIEHR